MEWIREILGLALWAIVLIALVLPPSKNKKIKELEERINELEKRINKDDV